MSRTKKGTPPAYPRHAHQSGQARITVRLTDGRRRDLVLGPFGSAKSRSEYQHVLRLLEANNGLYPVTDGGQPGCLSVHALVERFRAHAREYYCLTDGTASREQDHFEYSFRPLLRLHGDTTATSFGPLALKAVRQEMIDDGGLSRKVINQRIDHVKRLFRWAVSEELVPAAVYEALRSVAGLRRGHRGTYETPKVRPVPDGDVEMTLPHLLRQVAAMVQLQRLMGARPTEVCLMRGCDIDRTGKVWWYRIDPNVTVREDAPANLHKTAHHEEDGAATVKLLPLGPRAQAILRPWLRDEPSEYLFQPREARRAWNEERRARRKSPMTPSQRERRPKAVPERSPGDHYTRHSYARAIARACEKAGVKHWHPHQLKHAAATEVRRRHGAEAARVFVGHKHLKVTEIYAEADLAEVEQIALELG